MMAMWSATKMSYQLTLKMEVKVAIYKNHYLGYYTTDSNQTFTKMTLRADNKSVASVNIESVGQGDKVSFHKE